MLHPENIAQLARNLKRELRAQGQILVKRLTHVRFMRVNDLRDVIAPYVLHTGKSKTYGVETSIVVPADQIDAFVCAVCYLVEETEYDNRRSGLNGSLTHQYGATIPYSELPLPAWQRFCDDVDQLLHYIKETHKCEIKPYVYPTLPPEMLDHYDPLERQQYLHDPRNRRVLTDERISFEVILNESSEIGAVSITRCDDRLRVELDPRMDVGCHLYADDSPLANGFVQALLMRFVHYFPDTHISHCSDDPLRAWLPGLELYETLFHADVRPSLLQLHIQALSYSSQKFKLRDQRLERAYYRNACEALFNRLLAAGTSDFSAWTSVRCPQRLGTFDPDILGRDSGDHWIEERTFFEHFVTIPALTNWLQIPDLPLWVRTYLIDLIQQKGISTASGYTLL